MCDGGRPASSIPVAQQLSREGQDVGKILRGREAGIHPWQRIGA